MTLVWDHTTETTYTLYYYYTHFSTSTILESLPSPPPRLRLTLIHLHHTIYNFPFMKLHLIPDLHIQTESFLVKEQHDTRVS